jgi:hypothetical protein
MALAGGLRAAVLTVGVGADFAAVFVAAVFVAAVFVAAVFVAAGAGALPGDLAAVLGSSLESSTAGRAAVLAVDRVAGLVWLSVGFAVPRGAGRGEAVTAAGSGSAWEPAACGPVSMRVARVEIGLSPGVDSAP